MVSPIPSSLQERRRQSFLDMGGPNSIHNFASSFKRTQEYLGLGMVETTLGDDLSPCTSPISTPNVNSGFIGTPLSAKDSNYGTFSPVGSSSTADRPQGYDHINSFVYPADEEANMLPALSKANLAARHSAQGSSTSYQTIFNSVNTLMGIAMLSLSFGMKLSGLVVGTALLVIFSLASNETAKIIGRILKKHPEASTYGDIAYLYGGKKFQALATSIFIFDLVGASVLLVLLFADSFKLLFPLLNIVVLKFVIVLITFFTSFMPLRIISSFSVTGILSTMGVLVLIIICGFSSQSTPGSLLNPATINLWPESASSLFLSLGVFMAPWGGHPVFPELYKDMRTPTKYKKSCNISFLTTFGFDYLIAIVGFLMFGMSCEDSLTKNIMETKGYPSWINPVFCFFFGLLPISKLSLIVRPIISVYENYFRMNEQSQIVYKFGRRVTPISFTKICARAVSMSFIFILSLIFTSFGNVIAFLGSAICFTICLAFPLIFHLKINSDDLTKTERFFTICGIILSFFGGIMGSYASIAF